MKKNKALLAVLLGGVLAATAVAGGIAWNNSRDGREDERDDYISLEETTGEYLWTPHEEETDAIRDPEDVMTTDTEETQRETEAETPAQSVLEVPETPAADENGNEAAGMNGEGIPAGMEEALALQFDADSRISWPVEGEVIQEFSMDRTVYFPTLKQYKTSPALLIAGEAGTTVVSAADGLVTAVGSNEEIGNFVTMDLGGGYALTYGQLADISVTPNEYVAAGESLGTLAAPSIYYSVEGDNLYLKMTKDGEPVDPLDYLQ